VRAGTGWRSGTFIVDDAGLRNAIRDALRKHNTSTEDAIRRELATSFDLGHSGRLQFEIDGTYYGIWLIQTEEVVLKDSIWDMIPKNLLDEAGTAYFDLFTAIEEELVQWFADRWCAAGGPTYYSPVYVFFHGGLSQPRYDLEKRRWCSVDEVWPEENLR
jgi:hypothetical protein